MNDCLFCKIIKNEIPSYTIYEDEKVKVFLDVNPNSNGHTLIIPKKHIKDITDMDDETFEYLNRIIKNVYSLLEEKLKFDGMHIGQNNGICQEVKHFHLHLIPKYKEKQEITDIKEVYKKIVD